jgi:CRP/FNR family cyclic AMP-dependent transcriptional regulator
MALLDTLRRSKLFNGLSDEVLRRVAGLCHEEAYDSGTTIFSEGEKAQKLYILEKGLVALRIQPAGQEKSIMVAAIKEQGQIFGWSSLVEPAQYSSSAVCMEDSKVLAIKGEDLLPLLEENPSVGFVVMRRLAGIVSSRLRSTREQLISALAPGLISHG